MAAEIAEAPAIVERLLRDEGGALRGAVDLARRRSPSLVVFVARGSSAFAAGYARTLAEVVLGVPSTVAQPSVATVYHRAVDWGPALLVAVSQGGGSPDLCEVVSAAARSGTPAVAIVNDESSPLARAATHVVPLGAGPEAVTATKSYTAEVAALAALVAGWAGADRLVRELDRVPQALAVALDQAHGLLGDDGGLVDALAHADRAVVVSRGFETATARETALKLKEAGGLFAEGWSASDFVHGNVVVATPDVPLLAIRPADEAASSVDATLAAAAPHGAPQWVLASGAAARLTALADLPVPGAGRHVLAFEPGLSPRLAPIASIVAGQVIAEAVARARGHDPDAPEGLVKVIQTY
jgi:glutamine---fructose-6-phosphate transaminase (isomerizing)